MAQSIHPTNWDVKHESKKFNILCGNIISNFFLAFTQFVVCIKFSNHVTTGHKKLIILLCVHLETTYLVKIETFY